VPLDATCLGCGKAIDSSRVMVTVTVTAPRNWTGPRAALNIATPGKWHWPCCPAEVRRFASAAPTNGASGLCEPIRAAR
jgi:hypothetical protein